MGMEFVVNAEHWSGGPPGAPRLVTFGVRGDLAPSAVVAWNGGAFVPVVYTDPPGEFVEHAPTGASAARDLVVEALLDGWSVPDTERGTAEVNDLRRFVDDCLLALSTGEVPAGAVRGGGAS